MLRANFDAATTQANRNSAIPLRSSARKYWDRKDMKWILVVLVGGVAPVQTDLVFEKLSDCLTAEEQLQQTYAEAYGALNRSFRADGDQSERRSRRDYRRAREAERRRPTNAGTCVPHTGTDQPITSLDIQPATPSPQAVPPPAPSPSPSQKP